MEKFVQLSNLLTKQHTQLKKTQYIESQTCTLNFQAEPTGTPGIGPK